MSSCEVTKNCRFRRTQIDLTPIEVKDIVLTAHLKLKTKTQRGATASGWITFIPEIINPLRFVLDGYTVNFQIEYGQITILNYHIKGSDYNWKLVVQGYPDDPIVTIAVYYYESNLFTFKEYFPVLYEKLKLQIKEN